jgi:D-amino peptidase
MRVYISVDMEGVSGVTRWSDVVATGQDYQRARAWMTADVNAAVAGARRAGATDVVVEENHGVEMLCNLLLDEIDPDVEVVRGQPRGGATTAAALDESCDALMLVGHHAKVGDYPGVCAHTISYGDYKDVRLHGRSVSEGEIFATIAAQHGVPTVLVTGDDVVGAEMQKVCPGIETATVKRALSREAAAIVPPARAQRIIEAAAERAVQRLRAGEITAPDFTSPFPFEIELRAPLSDDAKATLAQRFPEFRVVDDHTVAFEHAEMSVAYRMAAITQFLARQPHDIRSY